jgi:hypothetical protein
MNRRYAKDAPVKHPVKTPVFTEQTQEETLNAYCDSDQQPGSLA